MIVRRPVLLAPEPPLTDGTIMLRGPRPGDAAGLLEEGRDEVTRRWVNVPIPYTEDDARDEASRLVRSWSDPSLPLGLILTDGDDDAYRGLILLFTDRPGEIAEIAYGAHPAARGRGLVARGLRLVAPWAFATLGVARLEARADPENIASQRTLENAGFTREGLERRSRAVHGVRRDMVCWSLLPEDLAAHGGPATAREGADAFVRDHAGRVLLVRRADDGRWAMPGGWVEPGEDAASAAVRETLEETGLIVEGPRLVHVYERERSRHSTYACRLAGGVLTPSAETPEVAFIDPATVTRWHADHGRRVAAAMGGTGATDVWDGPLPGIQEA